MPDELEFQKLKEQYPEIFENLPKELADLILSNETVSKISEICLNNEIENEEKIEKVAYLTSLVLLGGLKPEKFSKNLQKELDSSLLGEKIAQEINQSIFSQVKESLEKLYEIEVAPFGKPAPSKQPPTEPVAQVEPPPLKEPPSPKKPDIYREPTE